MVCGIVGIPLFVLFGVLPLLGVIFGLISAGKIKRSNGALTGLGMARAGWILGLVGLAGFGVFAWAAGTGRLDDISTADDTATVGSCVGELPAEGETVFQLDVVPCSRSHQAEVFAIDDLNPGRDRDFPGDSAMASEVESACVDAFSDFVGWDYDQSELRATYLVPTRLNWKRGGEYTCLVYDPAGDVTGTLANAER
jgi:hypothetical protein